MGVRAGGSFPSSGWAAGVPLVWTWGGQAPGLQDSDEVCVQPSRRPLCTRRAVRVPPGRSLGGAHSQGPKALPRGLRLRPRPAESGAVSGTDSRAGTGVPRPLRAASLYVKRPASSRLNSVIPHLCYFPRGGSAPFYVLLPRKVCQRTHPPAAVPQFTSPPPFHSMTPSTLFLFKALLSP